MGKKMHCMSLQKQSMTGSVCKLVRAWKVGGIKLDGDQIFIMLQSPGCHPKLALCVYDSQNLMDNLWSEFFTVKQEEFLKQNLNGPKDKTMAADHSETGLISRERFRRRQTGTS